MQPQVTTDTRARIDALHLGARELRHAATCLDRIADCLIRGRWQLARRYTEEYAGTVDSACEHLEGMLPAGFDPRPAA